MRVSPAECGLQDVVKLTQRIETLDLDAAPNGRGDIADLYVQCIKLVGFGHGFSEKQGRTVLSPQVPCMLTFHGSSSSMRLIGCSAIRASTWRRYASGSIALSLAVPIKLKIA